MLAATRDSSTALVPAIPAEGALTSGTYRAGMIEANQILCNQHQLLYNQHGAFGALIRQQEATIVDLQQRVAPLSNRVHELEDSLAGAAEARQQMEAMLARLREENQTLQTTSHDLSAKSTKLAGELDVSRREGQNLKARCNDQHHLLQKVSRYSATQQALLKNLEAQEKLKQKVQHANLAVKSRQNTIAELVGLVVGVVLAVFMGGWGFVVGVGVGSVGSGLFTSSALLPCMTPLYANLSSLQVQQNLTVEQIGKLRAQLSKSKYAG